MLVGLLYLAQLATLLLTTGLQPTRPAFDGAIVGGVFALMLPASQWGSLEDSASLRREITLLALIPLFPIGIYLAYLWVSGSDLRSLTVVLLLEGLILVPPFVACWRWFSERYDILNARRVNVLIVGTGETAREVCRWIGSHHRSGHAVVGFADEDESRLGTVLAMGVRIQTDYESIARFAYHRADRAIVALDEKRGKLPVRQLMELRLLGIDVEEATTFFERISGKIAIETMLPSWLIFSDGFKTSILRSALKRVADLLLATVLLILTAPLMLLAASAVLLTMGLPVRYQQERLGRDGTSFRVQKFRSMRRDAEAETGPTWSQRNDPRITPVGNILRKLRIDELPQLFNVLKGEMSFVGPRPERAHFVRQLEERIPYYGLRQTVRPGITGWAQVEYGYGSTDDDAKEKLKYDLYYIKNNNLLFDLWIVLKTVKVVLLGAGR